MVPVRASVMPNRVMAFAGMAHLPEREGEYREQARRVAEVYDRFLSAIEKLSAHVRREFGSSVGSQLSGGGGG